MVRVLLGLFGAILGALIGTAIDPPFDVLLIPVGAFAGYKIAPKGRRSRA